MPRFYLPPSVLVSDAFSLPDTAARHVQVLRYQPGEVIELFDGLGKVYQAEITSMGKKNVDVLIRESTDINLESPLNITLMQSISSSDRMDLTIQKAVELGVTMIQPVLTERSSQRLSGERAMKKLERWLDIAIGACEQCGRTVVPQIQPITVLSDALCALGVDDLKLLMSLNQPRALNQFTQPQAVVLLVGPEGGLSQAEEELAINHGFNAISTGPRVLRTETASLAAIAAMQLLWGDFRG
ncbi:MULTISPECIES: 16S rRNA (uracil(1498)-N(3))-methyltransferase [unclassified Snodgrassella]|uniref:16S rRNA (uracil(1498)-N(3))-methyltransferase n=1 Tax=unclassified Snodgrassella TaxID=2625236 RepID=UPI0018DCB6CF|nr:MULTISPECIES: 16S rRNA (uracil(1498)-N(3))-methyltransferase [unclassified Snodgrassella]MBI0159665.1 16S rRNA (uracil(1498)-N(3))-methyltransferase [Snodgrassella sp. W6238H11]MBI0161856.1 16S rRNA (uracil(1498)-N(3))-methyltransferase [Snodgrassella sp. W6238H14]